MGDRNFTLLELHFDDAQLGPRDVPDFVRRIGTTAEHDERGTVDEIETDDDAAQAADEDDGRSAVGVVVGLVALVAIALAVRRFRGDDEADAEELEEPDVVVN